MRISKKFVGLIILIVLVHGIFSVCLLSPSYLKIVLNELQNSEESFEIVFVGQSHGGNAFNPSVIEEKTKMPAYNLCRGLVCNRDVYYLVKESNYKNDVRCVVYDIDSTYWTEFENPNYFADGYVYPHLNNPINKMDYFFRYVIKENYRYNLCRYVLYGTGGLKAIPENIAIKLSKEYQSCDVNSVLDEREKAEYQGKGFFAGTQKNDTEYKPTPWNVNNTTESSLQAFKDMVSYCKENGIEFICVSSPLPYKRMSGENYSEYHEYFEKMAKENEVAFWDFNYINDNYLAWNEDDFQDSDGHMMGAFANEYSAVLGQMINEYLDGESVEGYFDSNWEK